MAPITTARSTSLIFQTSAKVKKCPVVVRRKAMVTRPIHCLRFVVLARIPQKHQATPQNPSQSSQYIAGIVRIARIARIPRQCNHSHSRATSYASGNTGTPRGYFCTFADGRHILCSLPSRSMDSRGGPRRLYCPSSSGAISQDLSEFHPPSFEDALETPA